MSSSKLKVAYLTAGSGGMICGSCLHDNALVTALAKLGCDAQLIPTYTPLRTDEEDVSLDRVFLGGINVYLQQKVPFLRKAPAFLDRWLDRPGIIRAVTRGRIKTDAAQLGDLTVSMLRGEAGNQAKEIRRLIDWLSDDLQPDLINFSNIMIAGCAAALKRRTDAPVLVTLQGDDLFLDQLVSPHREQAFDEIRKLVSHIDGFIVFSEYYKQYMQEYLGVPADRMHLAPLGLNVDGFPTARPSGNNRAPAIGFLARNCQAKGLHLLVDAYIRIHNEATAAPPRLRIAGWLGETDRPYFEDQRKKLVQAGCESHVDFVGEVSRQEKIEFLQSVDVLAVPTTYREPKGLYVLESQAAGTPVVLPAHGAFPELLQRTGGGRLFPPGDVSALAATLTHLLSSQEELQELATAGQKTVHGQFHAQAMARDTLEIYHKFVPR